MGCIVLIKLLMVMFLSLECLLLLVMFFRIVLNIFVVLYKCMYISFFLWFGWFVWLYGIEMWNMCLCFKRLFIGGMLSFMCMCEMCVCLFVWGINVFVFVFFLIMFFLWICCNVNIGNINDFVFYVLKCKL